MVKKTTDSNPTTKNRRRVTSGLKWREESQSGVLLTLPSGHTARIRSLGLDYFIKSGRIPDYLTSTVVAALNAGGSDLPDIGDLEQAQSYIDFLNIIVEMVFLEPKVRNCEPGEYPDDLKEDEITVWDIELTDKYHLMGVLSRPARLLDDFRESEAAHVAIMADTEDDTPAGE